MRLSIDVATFIGRLPIGKQGENLTTQVVFDCANWLGELTGGTLSIVHQRPTDTDGYPCGNYETTATTLTWDVNETDLAFCGTGQLELRYTIGDRIAKSRTFITQILKALTPMETPPEAYEPYIDRVIDAATQEMEKMTATAEAHNASSTLPSVTIEVTRVDDDHTNLNFIFDLVKGMGVDIHSANVYEDATKPSPFVEVVPYAATPAMELVDINFYNIKGEQGEPGDSIGTVTATVDSGVGTPSVTVTQTGGSGSPIDLSLAFHNLKGSIDPSYLPSDHATGNPATFPDGARDIPVDSLEADINPIQDLHGYTRPWPAGGGKNKYPILVSDDVFTNTGGATHSKADGKLTIVTSASSASSGVYVDSNSEVYKTVDKYNVPLTFSADIVASASGDVRVVFCNKTETFTIGTTKQRISVTATTKSTIRLNIYGVNNGATLAVDNVQIEEGSSATSYEPYANVCPISGRSSVDLTINGDTDSIALGQTVYGGKLNVTTGVLTIDKAFIASYNGETIGEPWISSLDEYVPGGTPTIGANVAYTVTSTTVQLTPKEVLTVLGSNSMAADSGDVTVYYRADIGLYIDKKTS